jgi:predicted secreted hydrolase
MSTSSLLKSRTLCAAAVAAAAFTVVFPQASSATASGFPTYVHLPADQAAHPSAAEDWWYTLGHVSSHGHEYGYEVQLISSGVAELAINDVTAGKYYTQQVAYLPGQFSVSATKLDVRMPDATLAGPMNAMHLIATLPQGRVDLKLNAKGPVLYDNATGLFPFLKGSSYYSLPNLQTTRTLTMGSKTSKVTGQSWLDRQWGNWD